MNEIPYETTISPHTNELLVEGASILWKQGHLSAITTKFRYILSVEGGGVHDNEHDSNDDTNVTLIGRSAESRQHALSFQAIVCIHNT